jgi:hypothetical protein
MMTEPHRTVVRKKISMALSARQRVRLETAAPASPIASLPKGAVQKIGTALTLIAGTPFFKKKPAQTPFHLSVKGASETGPFPTETLGGRSR